MSNKDMIIFIGLIAIVTMLLRFIPFILFDRGEQLPKWVAYLGKVLPPAVMSMLLIYCIRNINLTEGKHGLPELICIGIAAALHSWKGNTLISIGVSTLLYMIIVQM